MNLLLNIIAFISMAIAIFGPLCLIGWAIIFIIQVAIGVSVFKAFGLLLIFGFLGSVIIPIISFSFGFIAAFCKELADQKKSNKKEKENNFIVKGNVIHLNKE